MTTAEASNLALRFILEMCTLVALAYWGASLDAEIMLRIIAAVVAPLSAALVWGTFVAPKARIRVEDPARLAIELVFFGAGAFALMLAGLEALAVAFAVAVVGHVTLMVTLKQR